MIEKIGRRFRNMKREGLFLYLVIGIYLLYTARSVFHGLGEESGNTWVFWIFIVLFVLVGATLTVLSGYHLLRQFYLAQYMAQLEEEKTRIEAGEQILPKKQTGTEKYLEFMYRLFKIKQGGQKGNDEDQ